jgi:hypothetical protein
VLAFHDINPVAPVHFLVIPKLHIASMAALGEEHVEVMGKVMTVAARLAAEQGCGRLSHHHQHRAGSGGRRCIICTFMYWAAPKCSRPC